MVRCINEDIILQIIKDKNLLDKEQITNLKTIIEEAIIDNEIMIDILYENKILPLISNISYIKIYNYSYIQAYVVNGYFIYEDVHGNKITAINDLKILFSNNNIFRSIMLIKKYYFYKLLEKNFAHVTSIKAKYALGFKVGPIIAKNINYTNKVIIFFVVFIATLIYLPFLFHIANNISYCLQNILKSLLFIRAVRESSSVGSHGLKGVFGVIPWLDHGIQKIIKNTNISIFNWIPLQDRGMTEVKSLHKTMPYIDGKARSIQNHQEKLKMSQNRHFPNSLIERKLKETRNAALQRTL